MDLRPTHRFDIRSLGRPYVVPSPAPSFPVPPRVKQPTHNATEAETARCISLELERLDAASRQTLTEMLRQRAELDKTRGPV